MPLHNCTTAPPHFYTTTLIFPRSARSGATSGAASCCESCGWSDYIALHHYTTTSSLHPCIPAPLHYDATKKIRRVSRLPRRCGESCGRAADYLTAVRILDYTTTPQHHNITTTLRHYDMATMIHKATSGVPLASQRCGELRGAAGYRTISPLHHCTTTPPHYNTSTPSRPRLCTATTMVFPLASERRGELRRVAGSSGYLITTPPHHYTPGPPHHTTAQPYARLLLQSSRSPRSAAASCGASCAEYIAEKRPPESFPPRRCPPRSCRAGSFPPRSFPPSRFVPSRFARRRRRRKIQAAARVRGGESGRLRP